MSLLKDMATLSLETSIVELTEKIDEMSSNGSLDFHRDFTPQRSPRKGIKKFEKISKIFSLDLVVAQKF